MGSQGGREFGAGQAGFGDVEIDHIGLNRRRIEVQTVDPGQPLGQGLSVGVILGQAVDMMLQGVNAGRRDDPGLAHGAAELMFEAPSLVDEIAVARQHPADRTAQALRQIDPHTVAGRREIGGADARGDHRVEQPRAIHVQRQPMLSRRSANRL